MFEKYLKGKGVVAFPHTQSSYFITAKGDVIDDTGTSLPVTLDKDNQPRVFANLWLGKKYYLVADLMAIVFKNVKLPVNLWKEVEGFYIDEDVNNRHASNIGYRFRTHPLPSPVNKGFYYIPFYTSYCINEKGEIIGQRGEKLEDSWRIREAPKNNKQNIRGGYKQRQLVNDLGKRTSIDRHRLLALTFKPYPNNVDRLDVNHNNGVPGDDWLDNLDWMTRARNLTHAYKTGLRSQNIPIQVRDVRTGDVTEYYSISEGARALGLSCDEAMRFRLATTFSTVFQDGTQAKASDDTRDWIVPKDPEKAIKEASIAKGVRALNCRTMEEMEFESVTMCGRVLDIPSGTVSANLRLGRNGVHRGYQFRYLDDPTPWEAFSEDDVEGMGSIARPVKARNLLTKETKTFNSVKNCAAIQGITGTLSGRLREGVQPVYSDGWQYAYVDDAWQDVTDINTVVANCDKTYKARNVLTGEVFEASSILGLSGLLGHDPNAVGIGVKASGKLVYKGFQYSGEIGEMDWPEFSELDKKCMASGYPLKGQYYVLEDVKTGEVHCFSGTETTINFLKTVNSAPVFHRLKRRGELLDGKYRCRLYRPEWWLVINSQTDF